MIRVDPARTEQRRRALQAYMRANVLADGAFVCRDFPACRASRSAFPFYEGQLSHLGRHYDLIIDGRPTRIVVVGQEYGTPHVGIDLAERRRMIERAAQAGFRGRNPHMRGTTTLGESE